MLWRLRCQRLETDFFLFCLSIGGIAHVNYSAVLTCDLCDKFSLVSVFTFSFFSPGINVPRRRFLPVKMSSDLLLVMSNLYSLDQGSLTVSPERQFPGVPLVKLGQDHFKKVAFNYMY